MRILTNKYNLPDTLVQAVKQDSHKMAGTISVTELIDSPRIRILKKQHDYEVDVSDLLYALMGTALHHILERANISDVRKRAFILTAETIFIKANEIGLVDAEKAKRLEAAGNYILNLIPVFFPEVASKYIFEKTLRLELFGGHVLSGTFDLFDTETGILHDYKFCSTFAYTNPAQREKWKQQTNIYAYGLHLEGYQVNGIKIIAFFRDWSKYGLTNNRDYPPRQTIEIVIPLGQPSVNNIPWQDQVAEFIKARLNLHIQAETAQELPLCSGVDRWATADVYAVKTPKNKKAIKLEVSEAAAKKFIQENGHKFIEPFIEKRPGSSGRCEKYCPVSKHCSQWKREQEIFLQQGI
jgi:hypothetical protein